MATEHFLSMSAIHGNAVDLIVVFKPHRSQQTTMPVPD
jgi:hypothetical protein